MGELEARDAGNEICRDNDGAKGGYSLGSSGRSLAVSHEVRCSDRLSAGPLTDVLINIDDKELTQTEYIFRSLHPWQTYKRFKTSANPATYLSCS